MSKTYTRKEFAKMIGVTYQTLYLWEKKGRLVPANNQVNRKKTYTHEQYLDFMGISDDTFKIIKEDSNTYVVRRSNRSDVSAKDLAGFFVTEWDLDGNVEYIKVDNNKDHVAITLGRNFDFDADDKNIYTNANDLRENIIDILTDLGDK